MCYYWKQHCNALYNILEGFIYLFIYVFKESASAHE